MKKMELNFYTGRKDDKKKVFLAKVSLDERDKGFMVRNVDYDPNTETHKSIAPLVVVWDGYKKFSGSWESFSRKLFKDTTSAEAVVDILFGLINNICFKPNKFVELVARQHRTLQQSFTNICLAWLRHLASLEEGWYDGRNEMAVKVAKEICQKCPEATEQLPMI